MIVLGWIGVALSGGVGALLRLLLDAVLSSLSGGSLPFGTFAVNISGALALGLLSGLTLPGEASMLIGTALIGSYTTFSTWMLESLQLQESGELLAALGNVMLSLGAGFAAIAVGHLIGTLL